MKSEMKPKKQFPAPMEGLLLHKRKREGHKNVKARFSDDLIFKCKADGQSFEETRRLVRLMWYAKSVIYET